MTPSDTNKEDMAISTDLIEVDVTIRRIGYKPTQWTGERDQKAEQEVLEEFSHNKISPKEAIVKLLNHIREY